MESVQKEFVVTGTATVEEALEEFAGYGEKYKLIVSSMKNAEKLLKEFAYLRSSKDISQRDLAELTGIKQPQIARYEKASSFPRIDTLLRLLEALDYDLVLEKHYKPLIKFGSFESKNLNREKYTMYNPGRSIYYGQKWE